MVTRLRSQLGLSVVETLIAALLLGMLIMMVSPMMSYSFKSSQQSKERSGAVQAAQRILEEVQSQGFQGANAIVSATTPTAVLSNDTQGNPLYVLASGEVSRQSSTGSKLMQVQRFYSFSSNGAGAVDDTIQVTLTLSWPGGKGKAITMGTTLTRTGSSS